MKVAIVTGAQQGIGRAIALGLAREGTAVAINYLDDRHAAGAVAESIRSGGGRCCTVQGDVSRAADVERLVSTAEKELGEVDVLINNAGIFPRVDFLELSESEWDKVHDVNLKGTFLCSQAVARRLVKRRAPGAIVNVTSMSAYRGTPRGVHYAASKGGVVGFTRALALELAPHGIRVNSVAPGLSDTAQPRDGHSEAELKDMAELIPLGRMAQPESIADVALFLASDAARHMTGQVVHVNGGMYLGG
jgi:NAD(P)-dependent dehydrogenase (short-subunit alcohol dehydrogenase family)